MKMGLTPQSVQERKKDPIKLQLSLNKMYRKYYYISL